MIRESFNNGWRLAPGQGSLFELFNGGGGGESVPVQLPHDAMIHETPDPNDPSGGQTGFYPGGQYTYLKTFEAPASWRGKDVWLEFEGVSMTAMVFVNGIHVATNLYAYSGFYAKIDHALTFGADNEVKVIANNPTPNSRWYPGSGIYRSVDLLVGGDVHITNDGVRARTLLANADEAILEVETDVVNITRDRQTVTVRTTLCSDGAPVISDTVRATLFSLGEDTLRQSLYIPSPKLWNVDSPNLYELSVEVLRGDEALDAARETIGLRTLTLDVAHGLRINGVPVKQKGSCIHHDNGVIGAATFPAAEERRARQLKEAGFNAIRSAHHPMSRAMLEACDRVGLLVMDELSDMWYEQKNRNDFSTYFDACWEQEIERIVKKDYNHPCVILYSTGNEIVDLGRPTGGMLNRRFANRFHALDPYRFTTTAVNGLLNVMQSGRMDRIVADILAKNGMTSPDVSGDGIAAMNAMMSLTNSDDFACHPLMTEALEEPAQATDVAGFNYLTARHGDLEKLLHPNKTVLGTETYPDDIVRLWSIVEKYPHVLGDYTWTGYDYLGEAGCGIFYYDGTINFSSHFPDRIAYIGDIDIIGTRRPISYLRQTVYGDRALPYVAVTRLDRYGKPHSKTAWMYKDNIASWTWPGFEGKPTEVQVYSRDDEVELFLNGRSLGRKPAGPAHGFEACYEIMYEPGTLEAAAYTDGRETGRFALRTAGDDTVMEACVERPNLRAGAGDLAFVTVCLTDGKGILKPYEKRVINVSVEGPGVVQGFGSADPQPVRSYDDTAWETYDGKVMAVIRATDEAGDIAVTFACDGMDPVKVMLASCK